MENDKELKKKTMAKSLYIHTLNVRISVNKPILHCLSADFNDVN